MSDMLTYSQKLAFVILSFLILDEPDGAHYGLCRLNYEVLHCVTANIRPLL